MKKKIGILTIFSMLWSKIIYAMKMDWDTIKDVPILYGPPVQTDYGIPTKTNLIDIFFKIGKIAILPIILIIGIVVIVKIKKKKNKKDVNDSEEN